MANINRKKGSPAFERGDFIRPAALKRRKRHQTKEEQLAVLNHLAMCTAGVNLNKRS